MRISREDPQKYVKRHSPQSFRAHFAAGHFSHGMPAGTVSSTDAVWDSDAVEGTPDVGQKELCPT